MTESFLRFKKRAERSALIKSAVFALFAGLFCSSALAVGLKLSAIKPGLVPLLAAGVGSALVAFLIARFATRVDDASLAKKIDKELELEQKAQTMVEFAREDSDMLSLQREDTENKLSAYPTGSIKYSSILKNLITPLLAALMLTSALLVPLKTAAAEVDPPFKMSAWQEARLGELITYVNNSAMAGAPRAEVAESLKALRDTLREVDRESRMKAEVISTVVAVREINKLANSYPAIGKALVSSDNALVVQLGDSIKLVSATEAEQTLIDIQSSVTKENWRVVLPLYANAIFTLLSELEISEDDALLSALNRLASAMNTLTDYNLVPATFNRAIADIRSALLTQHTNSATCEHVEDELVYIFGIDKSELPKDEVAEDDEKDDSEESGEGGEAGEDEELNTGGFGTGEVIYGSDDLVYSPEDNDFVVYGTVLDNYFRKFTDWVIDNEVTEELEKLVNDYFTSLYGGIEEEK